jgi:hypothetical protein
MLQNMVDWIRVGRAIAGENAQLTWPVIAWLGDRTHSIVCARWDIKDIGISVDCLSSPQAN